MITIGQEPSSYDRVIDLDNHYKTLYSKYIVKQFPDFVVNKSDISKFSNKDLANKVVIIHFWFVQCAPCILEIDALNKMFNLLKDQPNFLFVSFTFDSEETIKDSIKKYDIQYEVIHLDKSECRRLNMNNAFPTNIILDKDGIIRYFTVGASDYQEEFIMTILYQKILELL